MIDHAQGVDAVIDDPFVREVAQELLAREGRMSDALFARIVAEDTYFADAAAHLGDDIRAALDEQLAQMLRALAGHEELDFDLARNLARRRASQGVPLSALLHSYRLASEVIWEHASDVTSKQLGRVVAPEQLLNAANVFFTLTDRYSEVVRQAFEDAVNDRFRTSRNARATLVDHILDGGSRSLPLIADAARVLDLPERGTFVAVAADAYDDAHSRDVEALLRTSGIRSEWRRRSERHIGIVVLEGRGCAPSQPLVDLLSARVPIRIGVSPAYHALGDTAEYVVLADIARKCRPIDDPGVTRFDDRPISTVVAASPAVAQRLARSVLGPLFELDATERAALLETLCAWRDVGGSTALAAQRLFCHRNTVRNRLLRVETLTELALDEPVAIAQICLALEALALAEGTHGEPNPAWS